MEKISLALPDLPEEIKVRISELMQRAAEHPGAVVEIPVEISAQISKVTCAGLHEEIMAIRRHERWM